MSSRAKDTTAATRSSSKKRSESSKHSYISSIMEATMKTNEARDNLGAIDRQLAELQSREDREFAIDDDDDDDDFIGASSATVGADGAGADDDSDVKAENVKVMVRCRPVSSSEISGNAEVMIRVHEEDKCVEVADERQFQFDAVFGPQSNNEQVYMKSVRQLVESAFKGYNCTVFLYGQTGTGKTYTHSSLTLSSFAHLFSLIRDSNTQARFLIRASYYELYNEEIRDLLSTSSPGKPLELRESKSRGVYVKDLTCYLINNLAELEKLKRVGDKQRATAATKMNEHSSRSHSIFSVTIETTATSGDKNTGSGAGSNRSLAVSTAAKSNSRSSQSKSAQATSIVQSAEKQAAGAPTANAVRVGRLHLIDLAGSERQSKSGSTGARLKEASRINLSLTCLSLVIRALTDSNATHVPYRNSKLTRLLSSSLGGNSKTLLIACISPAKTSLDETLNTLRFASRTKRIKNKARINEDAKDALLRKYRRQIEELKLKLKERLQQQQQQQISTPMDDDDAEAIESSMQYQEQQQQQQQVASSASNAANNELLQQLRLLKAKIMVGGENLLEKAEMHERLLEASRAELEEKRLEELRLKERLERKRQLIDRMTQSKGTLEGQVVGLDEKLKRALVLYKRVKEEQRDLASEHQQLKESLLQTIRATSKEIRYADCIIEDFIPREYRDLINTCAQYDDESDEWQIKYIALSGNNIAQTKRITEGVVVDNPASNPPENLNGSNSELKDGVYHRQVNSYTRPDPFLRLKDLGR